MPPRSLVSDVFQPGYHRQIYRDYARNYLLARDTSFVTLRWGAEFFSRRRVVKKINERLTNPDSGAKERVIVTVVCVYRSSNFDFRISQRRTVETTKKDSVSPSQVAKIASSRGYGEGCLKLAVVVRSVIPVPEHYRHSGDVPRRRRISPRKIFVGRVRHRV